MSIQVPPAAQALDPAHLLSHALEAYAAFGAALHTLIYTSLAQCTPAQRPRVAALIAAISYDCVLPVLGAIAAGRARGPSDAGLLPQIIDLRVELVALLGQVVLPDALRAETALRNSIMYEERYFQVVRDRARARELRIRPSMSSEEISLRLMRSNPW